MICHLEERMIYMGAWGITAFQSDAGLDFLHKVTENKEVKNSIENALESVICISSFCSELEMLAEIIANYYEKIECNDNYNSDPELLKAMECVNILKRIKNILRTL